MWVYFLQTVIVIHCSQEFWQANTGLSCQFHCLKLRRGNHPWIVPYFSGWALIQSKLWILWWGIIPNVSQQPHTEFNLVLALAGSLLVTVRWCKSNNMTDHWMTCLNIHFASITLFAKFDKITKIIEVFSWKTTSQKDQIDVCLPCVRFLSTKW